ncbi:MAG: ABC transporter substrate-binding protein [Rhodospirillales bacterium]
MNDDHATQRPGSDHRALWVRPYWAWPLRRARAADLTGVTLRVATFKGFDETLLPAAHLQNTPYHVVRRVHRRQFHCRGDECRCRRSRLMERNPHWPSPPPRVRTCAPWRWRKGDVNRQAVIVPKGSTISSIAELKGKRVGYVRATTSQYYLLKMLRQVGLGFGDITPVNLSPTDGRAAFQSGVLDAWAIYGYAIDFAIEQDGARVLKNAVGILSGNYLIGARPAALTDPILHATIADYLTRLRHAYDWAEANKAEYARLESKAVGVPETFIRNGLATESQRYQLVPIDDAAVASCQDVADVFAGAGLLPGHVNVAPYFDRSFSSLLAQS